MMSAAPGGPTTISDPGHTVQTTNYTATSYDNSNGHNHYAPAGYGNESRFRCCCNAMHVERGAYVIAIIGAIMAAIFGILNLLSGNIVLFVVAIFFFLLYFSIMVAQRKRQPNLYIPFLVLNWLAAFLLALYIIFLIIMLIALPDFWVRQHRDDGFGFYGPTERLSFGDDDRHHNALVTHTDERGHPRYFWGAIRLFTWLQLIYSVVAEILTIYFWFVVYRAWQYMRAEHHVPAVGRPGIAPAYKV